MHTPRRRRTFAVVAGAAMAGAICVEAASLPRPPGEAARALRQASVAGRGTDAQPPAPRGPAPSLTRATSSPKPADAAGFLRRWLVLEPVRTNGQLTESAVRALIDTAAPAGPLDAVPRHGETVTIADAQLAWHAVDTNNYNVNLYHFAYALNKPTSNVLFWAVTVVNAPREMPNVRLAICSNAASVWWLNGQEVIGIYNDRQAVIDDGVSKRLTLQQGRNVIRGAIVNGGGATDFCARFLDADDNPITRLSVSLDSTGK